MTNEGLGWDSLLLVVRSFASRGPGVDPNYHPFNAKCCYALTRRVQEIVSAKESEVPAVGFHGRPVDFFLRTMLPKQQKKQENTQTIRELPF